MDPNPSASRQTGDQRAHLGNENLDRTVGEYLPETPSRTTALPARDRRETLNAFTDSSNRMLPAGSCRVPAGAVDQVARPHTIGGVDDGSTGLGRRVSRR